MENKLNILGKSAIDKINIIQIEFFLGVIIENNFTWKKHLNKVSNKIALCVVNKLKVSLY